LACDTLKKRRDGEYREDRNVRIGVPRYRRRERKASTVVGCGFYRKGGVQYSWCGEILLILLKKKKNSGVIKFAREL